MRKKPIEAVMSELAPNKVELKRCLSTVELISLGLGAAVGISRQTTTLCQIIEGLGSLFWRGGLIFQLSL